MSRWGMDYTEEKAVFFVIEVMMIVCDVHLAFVLSVWPYYKKCKAKRKDKSRENLVGMGRG